MSKRPVKKQPLVLVQRGDGIFQDIGKIITKGFKSARKNKPLTKIDSFLKKSGLDDLVESIPVVGKTVRSGIKVGAKAGFGKTGAGVRGGAKRGGAKRGGAKRGGGKRGGRMIKT